MLLDPLEEQFHLPAAFVDLGDSKCWKNKVVGEKLEPLLRFQIEITNAPEWFRIRFGRGDGGQDDGVIGSKASGGVDRVGRRRRPS